jgi:ribosomal protein S18 acetylase RimI-like enzyme
MMNAASASFAIRDARPEDAPAIAELLAELGFPAAAETVTQRLAGLAQARETVLVILSSGELLGFVTVHFTPVLHRPTPVGRLTALVIAERARGRGLGRALVAAAEQQLTDAGCALVEITSNHKLTAAHAFYQRLGYTITSHRFCKTMPPPRQ